MHNGNHVLCFCSSGCGSQDVLKQVSKKLHWGGEEQNYYFFFASSAVLTWICLPLLWALPLWHSGVCILHCFRTWEWWILLVRQNLFILSTTVWIPARMTSLPPADPISVSSVWGARPQTSNYLLQKVLFNNRKQWDEIPNFMGLKFYGKQIWFLKDISLTMIK